MKKDIIKNICVAIFPKCREELNAQKRLEEQQKAEAYNKEREEKAMRFNKQLLTSIVSNCPNGQLILIKFPCGNWSEENLMNEVPNLVRVASKSGNWAYAHGGGLIVFDPDSYQRDLDRIAKAIWEPNRFLAGNKIKRWHYLEKVTT